MKRLVSLFLTLPLVLGVAAVASAAPSVDVTIDVLAASKTDKGFQGSARRYAKNLGNIGFTGARTIDTVTAKGRAEGSSVELRFSDADKKKRAIRVEVLDLTPGATKLRVEVPSLQFGTTTTHKKSGTILVVVPKTGLVLAVRPSA